MLQSTTTHGSRLSRAALILAVALGGIADPALGVETDGSGNAAPAQRASSSGNRKPETRPVTRQSREFLFNYSTQVTQLAPGQLAHIWLPVPPSNEDQCITVVDKELPAAGKIHIEPKYGNRILYLQPTADNDGTISLSVGYRVKRYEVVADTTSDRVLPQEVELFLKPDAKVPVGGKPASLLDGKSLPDDQLQQGRALFDLVNQHMRYSKEGTGWGQGDAVWACESRYGNCTDFHSLFISLARSLHIPAKFEIGFPLAPERGKRQVPGYHCWAWFMPRGRGWIPVDISQANKAQSKDPQLAEYYFGNLTVDRITFTVGRDLVLVPPQQGPPLNFFIYPYVEVAGQAYPADRIITTLTYEDLGDDGTGEE